MQAHINDLICKICKVSRNTVPQENIVGAPVIELSAKWSVPNVKNHPVLFMYIKNSNGPSTDPWGTPVRRGDCIDFVLSYTTYWNRLDK